MNVKKLVGLIGFGTIAILLLGGCASTYEPVIPKVKRLVNVERKVYHIPRETYIYDKIKNAENAKDFQKAGADCRVGDVEWYTKKGADIISDILNEPPSDTKNKKFEMGMIALIMSKNGGCVHPLTTKQKKAYKAERAQQLNLINAQLNYMAAKKQRRSSNINNNNAYNMNSYSSNYPTYKTETSQTTQKVGNTYLHSDGTSTQKVGNMYFNSDSSTTQKVGNMYFHSDGTTTQKSGDTYFHSN